jgi:hypothetical protein
MRKREDDESARPLVLPARVGFLTPRTQRPRDGRGILKYAVKPWGLAITARSLLLRSKIAPIHPNRFTGVPPLDKILGDQWAISDAEVLDLPIESGLGKGTRNWFLGTGFELSDWPRGPCSSIARKRCTGMTGYEFELGEYPEASTPPASPAVSGNASGS